MAIIRRYKTRKEAEDTMVDIVDNINGYGKMSMTEVLNWIGVEKELSHDPIEAGISFDDIGWVKSSTTDFEVDKAKVGFIISLPEPRPLVKYPTGPVGQSYQDEPSKTMSIRGFETRVQAMDLISVLTDLITDYGQMSIHDLLEGIKDSEQRLCYDKEDRIFEYIAKPGAEGNDITGWVTADGVKFMVTNPSGYRVVLPEPRPLVKNPTAIQEALDKGILQEMKPIEGRVRRAQRELTEEKVPVLFNHNPEEKPLGYFIPYQEGMDRKGALEASLKEMELVDVQHNERDQRAAKMIEKLAQNGAISEGLKEGMLEAVTSSHGIEASKGLKQAVNSVYGAKAFNIYDTLVTGEQLDAIRDNILEDMAQKPLEDYCDEDVKAVQNAWESIDAAREKRLEGMKVGQGEKVLTEHGAMRESNEGRGRFDLIPYESMEALAIWSEQGAIKYGDRNWEKGLSVKDCINRLIRHALKAGSGWTDEDHLAAAMWNASAAITMMKRRPDCDDHVWVRKVGQPKEETHDFTCPNCGGHNYKYKSGIGKCCDDCPWTEKYETDFTCPNCGGHNFKEDSAIGRYCTDCPWNEVLQQKEEMREYRQKKTTGVEVHSCPYCGMMDPKEKWYKYTTSTPHECIIYTCKECRKQHEELIPTEDFHQCSFCGYVEPTSKWKKEPINGCISIYTCKECGKEHEWRDKL